MIPDNLILDCTPELHKFRGTICELDMPTIDVAVLLSHVFDDLVVLENAVENIGETAFEMAQGEKLFENSEFDDGQQQRVITAVFKLGCELKNKLVVHHAYRSGILPYNFRNHINDFTIILSKSNQDSDPPT